MSIRPAETGRPSGRPRRDRSGEVYRITSAPSPGHEDRDARFVRYAWQMGIRTVCFVLAFFTTGWVQIVFFILAIVLPYLAVVLANNGAVSNGEVLDAVPPTPRAGLTARLELTGAPETLIGTTTDDVGPDGARPDRAGSPAAGTTAPGTRDTAGTTVPAPETTPDTTPGEAPDRDDRAA